jgi:phosphatidylserine decarboxylase
MTNNSDKIAREGYTILLISAAAAVVGMIANPYLGVFLVVWLVFCLYFFRNPSRTTPASGLISPADGKIIFIGSDTEKDFLNCDMQRITIFMSPFNVHVNRSPETGVIKNTKHHIGKFLAAFDERASTENERVANHMLTDSGDDIVFVQIAGRFARRIVSYAKPSAKYLRGQIFGVIKFGSRMDVFLPDSYQIQVQMNQKVTAGETVLAKRAN